MDGVGESVQKAFNWIPVSRPCFIVMDNAGGHGTDNAIIEHTNVLKEKCNIEIIHQAPRSPHIDLLDLGVWCSLQAQVEKEHHMKRTDIEASVDSVH